MFELKIDHFICRNMVAAIMSAWNIITNNSPQRDTKASITMWLGQQQWIERLDVSLSVLEVSARSNRMYLINCFNEPANNHVNDRRGNMDELLSLNVVF